VLVLIWDARIQIHCVGDCEPRRGVGHL